MTSNNVNISGFSVNNATGWQGGYGFFLDRVNNVTLSHNIVMNNIYGIALTSSDNNTVSNNTLLLNEWGINLESGNLYNKIAGNTVDSNTYYGIILWSSSDENVVANNTVMNNERGITLGYSDYNVIVSNYITNNSIVLELQQISNNNTVYWNSFIDNTVQLGGYQVSNSSNALDNGYPSGGNYWSDYAGADLFNGPYQNTTGSDGIGDSPYAINANNTDRYPLMTPYVIPEFAPTLSLIFCVMATIASIAFYKKRKIRHTQK